MGPLVSGRHRDRVVGYIEKGIAEGARLVLDGRSGSRGNAAARLLSRTIDLRFGRSGMTIARDEIFGPVASVCPVDDLAGALEAMRAHPNANAASIFTSSGRAAREFAHLAPSSMVGVNVGVAAPMAYFPFGGARDSFFGDLKVHGRDAFEFYTDKKVVTSRWF